MRNNTVRLDGGKVAQLRKQKAWDQGRLAAKAGVTVGTVANAEKSKPLQLETINCLATALGVEPRDLLLDEAQPTDGQDARHLPDVSGLGTSSPSSGPDREPLALKVSVKVGPLDGEAAYRLGEAERVFVNGCKFCVTLQNVGDLQLLVHRVEFPVSPSAAPAREKEREAPSDFRFGAIATPHQLLLELSPERLGGGWNLDHGSRHEHRELVPQRPNLLEAAGDPPILFLIDPGRMEVITGAVRTRAPGLYRAWFAFWYTVGDREYEGPRPALTVVQFDDAEALDGQAGRRGLGSG
jgi:transcriptional regulator with XRE-family HTH domain